MFCLCSHLPSKHPINAGSTSISFLPATPTGPAHAGSSIRIRESGFVHCNIRIQHRNLSHTSGLSAKVNDVKGRSYRSGMLLRRLLWSLSKSSLFMNDMSAMLLRSLLLRSRNPTSFKPVTCWSNIECIVVWRISIFWSVGLCVAK